MKIWKFFLLVVLSLNFFVIGYFFLSEKNSQEELGKISPIEEGENLPTIKTPTSKVNPDPLTKGEKTPLTTESKDDFSFLKEGNFLSKWEEYKEKLLENTKIHPEEKAVFNFFMKVIGKGRTFGDYYLPPIFNYALIENRGEGVENGYDDLSLNLKFEDDGEEWNNQKKENFFLFKLMIGFIYETYKKIIKPSAEINKNSANDKKIPPLKINGQGSEQEATDESDDNSRKYYENDWNCYDPKNDFQCYKLKITHITEIESQLSSELFLILENKSTIKENWKKMNVGFFLEYPKNSLKNWIQNRGKLWLTNENSFVIESFFIFLISQFNFKTIWDIDRLEKNKEEKFDAFVRILKAAIINHQGDVTTAEWKILKKNYLKSDFFYMQKFLKFYSKNDKNLFNNYNYLKFKDWTRSYYRYFEHLPSKVFMGLLLFNKLSKEEILVKGEKWKIAFGNLSKKEPASIEKLKQEWIVSSNFASLDTSKIKIQEEEEEIFTQFIKMIKDQKTGYPIPLELEFNIKNYSNLENDEMWEEEKKQYKSNLSLAIFSLKNGKIVWNNQQKEAFFHLKMLANFLSYGYLNNDCENWYNDNDFLLVQNQTWKNKERFQIIKKEKEQSKISTSIVLNYKTNNCLVRWKNDFSNNFYYDATFAISSLFSKIITSLHEKKMKTDEDKIFKIINLDQVFLQELNSIDKKLNNYDWDYVKKEWVSQNFQNKLPQEIIKSDKKLKWKHRWFLEPLFKLKNKLITKKDKNNVVYSSIGKIDEIFGLWNFKKYGVKKIREEIIKFESDLEEKKKQKQENYIITSFSAENKNYFWTSLAIAIGVIVFIIINFLFWSWIKRRKIK